MEPFYESWVSSSHADVACVKCHFPPGIEGTVRGKVEGLVQLVNYVGRSYTRRRPWAEIDDASCLQSGCHATRTLSGTVTFKGVVFNHESHLGELRRGKELRCTSCHSQVVQGDHIVVTETACFLCHLKPPSDVQFAAEESGLGKCQTCHDWSAIPAEERAHFRYDHTDQIARQVDCAHCHNQTIEGDGFVPLDNCSACHFERERLDEYDNPELLHRVHIAENKIECVQCHLRIQHKIQRLTPESNLNCSVCHGGTHSEQLLLFTGGPLLGRTGPGNPMFDVGLNCESCHVKHRALDGLSTRMDANAEACVSCHGEGYDRLLGQWERAASDKLSRFRRDLANVERLVGPARRAGREGVAPAADEAREVMDVVQIGKAVHNPAFADELLRYGYEQLAKAVRSAGVVYALPKLEPSTLPGDCASCHAGVENLSTPYRRKSFSHTVHAVEQGVGCKDCHSNERIHGQMIMPSQQCNSCHHKPPLTETCGTCHETALAFYAGTYADSGQPDVMNEAGVGCLDCHSARNAIVRPDAQICLDCHDSGYDDMGNEWLAEIRTAVSSLEGRLRATPPQLRSSEEFRLIRTTLEDVISGSGNGAHNYLLASDLLADVKKRLDRLEAGD